MNENSYRAYIGTVSLRGSKGIYILEIDKATEKMSVTGSADAVNPDYLTAPESREYLYAAMDTIYYKGKATAGVYSFRIEKNGNLSFLNSQPSGGQLNCYVHVDRAGKNLYSASYMGGNITIHPINEDGSLEPLSRIIQHEPREGKYPSIHSVIITPDKKHLIATDVGLDAVFMYELDSGEYRLVTEVPAQGRPRQTAFSHDGRFVYISTETGGEVFVYSYKPYDDLKLIKIQRISTVPEGFESPNVETAGIKMSPNGELLIVSNRCPALNDLSIFEVDKKSGLLTAAGRIKPPGIFPRDFDFTPDGEYVLVGMQFSDTVELYKADYENKTLIHRNGIKQPNCGCVLFVR